MPTYINPFMAWRRRRSTRALGVTLAVVFGSLFVTPVSAFADTVVRVNWTQIGIFPRAAASMESPKVGAALSDGTEVSLACETEGEAVSNGSQTITIWDQLSDGTWLPNAFLDTGTASWTPGVPQCDSGGSAPLIVPDTVIHYDGDHLAGDAPIAYELLEHYLAGSGRRVVLETEDLDVPGFQDEILSLGVGQVAVWSPPADTDLFWASGSFTVSRETTDCWATWDHYDFDPDKVSNYPYIELWAAQAAGARTFDVNASGCFPFAGGGGGTW